MPNQQQECTRYLIYRFSAEEKDELSATLVRNTQDLETLQDRKTQVMSDFTAKIKAANAEIFKMARLLGNGYEYRDIKCTAVFDEPRKGMKRVFRNDTGEVVAEEAMTAGEMQYMLDLDLDATQAEVKAEQQPAAEPAPDPQPETVEEEPAEEETPAVEEMPSPLSAPLRIEGSGEKWKAEIIVLETASGYEAEVSVQFGKDTPIAVKTGGAFLSEEDCRKDAATALWTWARERMIQAPRWLKGALREVMAWSMRQTAAPQGDGSAE